MYKIWKWLGLLKMFDTKEETWLAKRARLSGIQSVNYYVTSGFLKVFRDPIRVHRVKNRVPKIRENYQRVPRIRKIRSVQVHTGYLTSLKNCVT